MTLVDLDLCSCRMILIPFFFLFVVLIAVFSVDSVNRFGKNNIFKKNLQRNFCYFLIDFSFACCGILSLDIELMSSLKRIIRLRL